MGSDVIQESSIRFDKRSYSTQHKVILCLSVKSAPSRYSYEYVLNCLTKLPYHYFDSFNIGLQFLQFMR